MSKLNELVEKLKARALATDMTVDQVEAATLEQVKNYLGLDGLKITGTVFDKIKRDVKKELIKRDRKAIKDMVSNRLKDWLDQNYPNAEVDWMTVSGKLLIELWLEGRPE